MVTLRPTETLPGLALLLLQLKVMVLLTVLLLVKLQLKAKVVRSASVLQSVLTRE